MPRASARNAWARPAASGRRPRWERRPHHRSGDATAAPTPPLEDPIWEPRATDSEAAAQQCALKQKWHVRLLWRATRLWAPDFRPLIEAEALEAPVLRARVVELYSHQVSTYRARLKDARLLARYDAKTERMIRDETAVARRRRNQSDIPFSVDARSISYFNQRVPERVWKDNQKGLRIEHRDTCMKVLNAMMEVEPQPGFIVNRTVSVFGCDQCNHWQSASTSKKGEFRGAERLNSQGMPMHIRSETVLNIVERQIPFTMPLLTSAEYQLIQQEGRTRTELTLSGRSVSALTHWFESLFCSVHGGLSACNARAQSGGR